MRRSSRLGLHSRPGVDTEPRNKRGVSKQLGVLARVQHVPLVQALHSVRSDSPAVNGDGWCPPLGNDDGFGAGARLPALLHERRQTPLEARRLTEFVA